MVLDRHNFTLFSRSLGRKTSRFTSALECCLSLMLIGLSISSLVFSCLVRLLWHNEVVMLWSCFPFWDHQTRIIFARLFGREGTLWLPVQVLFVDSILMLIVMVVAMVELVIITFIVFVVVAWVLIASMELRLPHILWQVMHFINVVLRLLWDIMFGIIVLFFEIPEFLSLVVMLTLLRTEVLSILVFVLSTSDFLKLVWVLQLIENVVAMFPFLHDWVIIFFDNLFGQMVLTFCHNWVIFYNLFLGILATVLTSSLEILDNIDGDWTHVSIDERHAALGFARDKHGAASTETVSIVFTAHAITSVNCAKNIARKLGNRLSMRLRRHDSCFGIFN